MQFYDCLFSPISCPLSLFPFSESRSFLYFDIFLNFNICKAIVLTFFSIHWSIHSLIHSTLFSQFLPTLSCVILCTCDPSVSRWANMVTRACWTRLMLTASPSRTLGSPTLSMMLWNTLTEWRHILDSAWIIHIEMNCKNYISMLDRNNSHHCFGIPMAVMHWTLTRIFFSFKQYKFMT